MSIIKNGDLVYIIYDKRRKWVRKALKDNEFHSDRGFIKFNEIIGKNYGETAFLHPSNHKVAILPALFSDVIYFMKRQSQIIYPEDIGLILTYGG
ncbi:MAG: tRNA methyltransferase, partial [Promethearchaeota archaeon]